MEQRLHATRGGSLRDVRDKYLANDALPASTLVVVAGLALPEYLLEIEAVAAIE